MNRYLIGSSEDLREEGLYPLAFVESISKEDLLRCKDNPDTVIVDLVAMGYYNPTENEWLPLKTVESYKDIFD